MYTYEKVADALCKKITGYLDRGLDRLPTQEELCREYGVSRVTVRRALHILEEQGYLRNVQGSGSILLGLSPQKEQNQIYMLLSDPDSYTMPALIASVRNAATKEGFSVLLCQTNGDFQRERDILGGLLLQKVLPRGMFIEDPYPLTSPNEDMYRTLASKGCRVACMYGKDSTFSFAGCLRADNAYAARNAIVRLAALGHHDIAGMFTMADRTGIESCAAYLEALRDNHCPLSRDRLLLLGDMDAEEIIRSGTSSMLRQFLERISASCTALVCGNDLWAYAAAATLSQKGIHVPQDLGIISLRTSYLRQRSALEINSFELSADPGQAALHLLLHDMNRAPAPTITLPLRYQPGNSLLVKT